MYRVSYSWKDAKGETRKSYEVDGCTGQLWRGSKEEAETIAARLTAEVDEDPLPSTLRYEVEEEAR